MSSIPFKENKNIEFKERLVPSIHLKKDRKQQLASQMKYRLEKGKGTAVYVLGVDDRGISKGLTDIEFEESLNVLKTIASEAGGIVANVEKFSENGKLIGRIIIKQLEKFAKQHITVGACGHVGHGKSTLIATLMTGRPDEKGEAWLYLNVLPHEIERGLSADLHYALYGFKDGKPVHFKNPLDKRERSKVVEESDKIISFVDTVGHSAWLYTTIRGLVGQELDYSLLVVAADDGVTSITREHLGICLAMDLPVIVCITKTDRVDKNRVDKVEQEIEEILKHVGKVPFKIEKEEDIQLIVDKLATIVPVIKTSAKNFEGFDLLNKLLSLLPPRERKLEEPFLMFVDRVYKVPGAGTVVSGTIKQGRLKPGSMLLLGPDTSGNFREVKAKSIEMHYHRLSHADAGFVVGIALRGVKHDEIERGMVLCDPAIQPKAHKSFEAEILVLTHPTRIATGYEPVVHDNTISEAVKLECLDKPFLMAGDSGKVKMTFKFKPHFIRVGDKFVFREGKTKGIGTILKVF